MSKGFFRASVIGLVTVLALTACGQSGDKQDQPLQGTTEPTGDNGRPGQDSRKNWLEKRKGIYAPFTLTADLSSLGDRQKIAALLPG